MEKGELFWVQGVDMILTQTQSQPSDWIYESKSKFLFQFETFLHIQLSLQPILKFPIPMISFLKRFYKGLLFYYIHLSFNED